MSTRWREEPTSGDGRSPADSSARRTRDQCEEVALVVSARRGLLLRAHRHRLRREDLEDCFSQATLELIAHVKAGGSFSGKAHIANALELRFVSRTRDRRRAMSGRSPIEAAIEHAETLGTVSGDGAEIVDRAAAVDTRVILRDEIRRLGRSIRLLSADQRLVLSSQLSGESCAQFCDRREWSREKYRKVAQRARARLRTLSFETPVPPARRPSDETAGPAYDQITSHA